MNRRALLVSLALATAIAHVDAAPQSHATFRSYGSEQGLENLSINQIAQTGDGLLWIATEDGLYRYDGSQFHALHVADGLPGDEVLSLRSTGRGLWVGTTTGLAWVEHDHATSAGSVPRVRINEIALDRDNGVWVATDHGLYHGGVAGFRADDRWSGPSGAVVVTADGRVIVGRGKNLAVSNGDSWRVLDASAGFDRDRIDQIVETQDGSVWVRSQRFLWQCDAALVTCRDVSAALPDVSEVGRMFIDHEGQLHVSTRSGLARRDRAGRWTVLSERDGLPVRSVIVAFEDREGSLWMAGDQLYQALGRGLWRGYTPRTGFPADTAWTMVRDRQQTLWVGTNRGVVVEAGDVWSTIRGTEAYTIEALADAGPVMYAAGTNGTVMAIDRASGATTVVGPSADLANNNMSSMLEIDGTLWVGTLNKGLLRMDGQTWRAEALPGGTTTEDIGQLLLDRAGRLWVAGNGGLAMRERGRWRRFTKADGLESTMVAYLVERASGEICVAYSQALGVTCFRYTNGLTQLSTINRAVGLTSDKLYLLGEDRHGRLYAGMGVGLDVIDGGVIEHFSTSSGMVGDDCAARAFLAEPTGEVLIGTTHGLARFDAGRYRGPPTALAPLVISVVLGGEPILQGRLARSPHPGTTSLDVRVATPTFLNRGRLEQQLRLTPLDTEWRTSSADDARYAELPPGSYLLEIRSRLGTAPFGPVTRLPIIVDPSWWQTLWFRVLAGLLVVVAIAVVIRWRARVYTARASARIQARSEASFRALIEQSPDAVIVHRDGTIIYANAKIVALLGRTSATELIGAQLLGIIHPDDRDMVRARVDSIVETGVGTPVREIRLVRADGAVRITEVSAIQIDFDGAPSIVATARDCTERKALEARMMISDRMASIGTLAAGIAHEINNPLAYVKANLALLREDIAAHGSAAATQALISDALEGAERVENIVKGVRSFSRIETEKRVPIDVQGTLELALRLTSHELRQHCEVVTDYQPTPAVMGDPSRLGQVFTNLLLNAAQAMSGGATARSTITLRMSTDDQGRAAIDVRDQGCGMTEEVARRAFEPFFTTKDVGEGTGLGLAVCHGIIQSMGGTITIHSVLGEGTTVRVLIPRAEELPVSLAPSPMAETSGVRYRVLVVDDDEQLLKAVGRILKRDNEVVLRSSGTAALDLLATDDQFDLILCDVMMPDYTGVDLHTKLQEDHPTVAGRMLFMTGGAFTSGTVAFLEQPTTRWIEKPVEPTELRRLVQTTAEALRRS